MGCGNACRHRVVVQPQLLQLGGHRPAGEGADKDAIVASGLHKNSLIGALVVRPLNLWKT